MRSTKCEMRNDSDSPSAKQYDLEPRTMLFAKDVRKFCRKLPRTIASIEDCKQLIRSSGSVAANYIEANEALSKKDFLMRSKICRKEAKESMLWPELLEPVCDDPLNRHRQLLLKEAGEFMLIFASIILKSGGLSRPV